MRYPRLIATAGFCAALATSHAFGQVYKWVDAQGVTHYDATPPAGSSNKVQTLPISTQSAAGGADDKSWQEKDNEFRARYDKRKSDEAKEDEKKKKELAQRQSACIKARTRLQVYQQAGRIYHTDQDGNRTFLSDSEKDQEQARIQAIVASSCNG